MSNKGKNLSQSNERKVYIRNTEQWVEVTEAQYRAYYRDIWATRKRAQGHHQCMCPRNKQWMCDGDCLVCPFHAAGDNLSLDYTVTDKDGNEKSWLDNLVDDRPDIQSTLEDRELLDVLLHKLDELDPEGRRICELVMEGRSERDCGKEMGMARNTFVYKRDKLFAVLADYLKDFI
ncbi:hypothetical protein HCH52_11430 [Oscillospiraceae bacterium HV4-5-C5C]|nr:hypothetical protein [Oscillospiraceae bacterium HV4-5-C5C]